MGCWNKTCGLSQLPIHAGTPTVNFLIVENIPYGDEGETPNQPCYADTYWSLIPLPFYGEYNDYGWQEDDAGEEWKYSLLDSHYKNSIVLSPSGVKDSESKFKIYGDAGENPFANSKNLGNAIHGNLINIKNYSNKPAAIASMMIDRKLFEELTVIISSGPRYGEEEIILSKYELVTFAENIIKYVKSVTDISEDDDELATALKRSKFEFMILDYNNSETLEAIGINREDSYYHPAYWFWSWLLAGISSHGFETRKFLREQGMNIPAKELVDAFLFNHLMDSLRRQFIPMGHEGSQDGVGDIHLRFAAAYTNRVNAIIDSWEWDEDGEYEED